MSIQLFIDTNIYLKFYHYSNDDLEELNKLIVLMENDKLELYLPEQVENEFYRNREVKLADALKSFNQSKLNNQFPQFCKEYEEYGTLKKIIRSFENEKQALLKNIMLAIESNTLNADDIINKLFEKASFLSTTEEIADKAKFRYDVGNPPGKDKSYGDAINWETLLLHANEESDLYFIADDKDWFSKINNSDFNPFLSKEWEEKKNAKIKYYRSLSDFFKDIFPDIKLASELEKDILIAKLIESGSFYSSRKILKKLSKFETFTPQQASDYILASLDNSQILWISEDEDINTYLNDFVDKNKEQVSEELLDRFKVKIPDMREAYDEGLPW